MTPESVEDIIVEPDGEWHTADAQYSSSGWRRPTPPRVVAKTERAPSVPMRRPSTDNNSVPHGTTVYEIAEDSDDEDEEETRIRHDLSRVSQGSARDASGSNGVQKKQAVVIDLTLSSDDEEAAEDDATAVDKGKRKASSDEYNGASLAKRLRTEDSASSIETLNPNSAAVRRPAWSPPPRNNSNTSSNGAISNGSSFNGGTYTNPGSLRSHYPPSSSPPRPREPGVSSYPQLAYPDPYHHPSRYDDGYRGPSLAPLNLNPPPLPPLLDPHHRSPRSGYSDESPPPRRSSYNNAGREAW